MPFLKTVWKWGRWVLFVAVLIYAVLVVIGTIHLNLKEKSARAVEAIHAREVTVADATWQNLPEAPDPATDDATVEGIDANGNGIRDDAELGIYLWHKDSARIRAAELQYAQAIQSMLTDVFDSATWVAAAEERGRGYGCIYDAVSGDDQLVEKLTTEIDNLVLDTDLRRTKMSETYKFQTSFGLSSGKDCDVDLRSLPN